MSFPPSATLPTARVVSQPYVLSSGFSSLPALYVGGGVSLPVDATPGRPSQFFYTKAQQGRHRVVGLDMGYAVLGEEGKIQELCLNTGLQKTIQMYSCCLYVMFISFELAV